MTNEQLQERKTILLNAAFDILKQCNDGIYIKNVMSVTAFWDGAEYDGFCLMGDIKDLLGIED